MSSDNCNNNNSTTTTTLITAATAKTTTTKTQTLTSWTTRESLVPALACTNSSATWEPTPRTSVCVCVCGLQAQAASRKLHTHTHTHMYRYVYVGASLRLQIANFNAFMEITFYSQTRKGATAAPPKCCVVVAQLHKYKYLERALYCDNNCICRALMKCDFDI